MNRLTSRQRQLVYFVAMVLLLIPIVWLGRPAGKAAAGPQAGADSAGGGKLAQLRHEYDLGESNLGKVDPTSATINLVLVGLRGPAASVLQRKNIEYFEHKDWAPLRANVESIILLQPHYVKVWEFQSWNLAYNVSGEWDLVEDKYFWIKDGAKFAIRGTQRNSKHAALYWWVGIILGDKISRHDAWRYMRKFFNPDAYERAGTTTGSLSGSSMGKRPVDKEGDPLGDPEIWVREGRVAPDPELNPDGRDNYLVAKDWFLEANEVDLIKEQHRMASVAFREKPARSQMAYAETMQREGRFERAVDQREMRRAWEIGLRNWVEKYDENDRPGLGQELFDSMAGLVRLNATDEDLKELIQRDNPPGQHTLAEKKHSRDILRGIVNYEYWQIRAEVEKLETLVKAHAAIYKGKQYVKKNELPRAMATLQSGLQLYAQVLLDNPQLKREDNTTEEVIVAIMAWREAKKLLYEQVSASDLPQTDPPLNALWNASKNKMSEYRDTFNREFRLSQ